MSSRDERQPWFFRFCDTFLQEQNIKWMLAVGMLILLGSSLMLVTSHWDSYTPVWKLLVLVGYTAGLHVAGQVTYRSLGLHRTGTGLMALTVLLIPLPFYSLSWVAPELAGSLAAWGHHAGVTAILCLSTVFAIVASGQIFRHFLGRPEYVFTAAYVVLSLAGAVIPALPATAAPIAALVLWLVFAAGSMRVNQHIFWLAADHRWPRVCAFFPVLLLGTQFLILFASSLAPGVPLEWLGFGTVMTAIPILAAADQQARVLQQTGIEVSRSTIWSTAVPLFAGLVLTISGVCLAATEFPRGIALVPTAGLAAMVMYTVARRTNRVGFVWLMLILTVITYQSTPVFFREFAGQIVQQSAQAVHESRLPIAFYGLTYLPLLLTLCVCSVLRRRAEDDLLAVPLRQFSVAAGGLLMLASLLHIKAIFPVGVALTGLFALQAGLFRSRNVLRLGVVSLILAAAGITPFAETVLGIDASGELPLLASVTAAAVLCLPGRWADMRAAAWDESASESATWSPMNWPVCQTGGLLVALASTAAWLLESVVHRGVSDAPLSGMLLTGLLLLQAVHRRKPWLCDLSLVCLAACSVVVLLTNGVAVIFTVALGTAVLTGLWLLARMLHRFRRSDLAGMFADSADRLVLVGFTGVFTFSLVPAWFDSLTTGAGFFLMVPAVLTTAWTLAEASRRRTGTIARVLSVAGWIALLASVGVAVTWPPGTPALNLSRVWLPAVWAALSVVCIPVLRCCSTALRSADSSTGQQHASVALGNCVLVTLGFTTVASLLIFTTPMRVAGVVSLAGLLLLAWLWKSGVMRTVALMLVNWQLLWAIIQAFAPQLLSLMDVTTTSLASAAIPVALLAAVQALAWQVATRRFNVPADSLRLCTIQRYALSAVAVAALLSSLNSVSEGLHLTEILLAAGVFITLAADCLLTAIHLAGRGEMESTSTRSDSPAYVRDGTRVAGHRAAGGGIRIPRTVRRHLVPARLW